MQILQEQKSTKHKEVLNADFAGAKIYLSVFCIVTSVT